METTFSTQSRILDKEQIRQKIKRIAFEIYEHNFEETELVIVGIAPNGYVFAELLHQELCKISPFSLSLHRLQLDKTAPAKQSLTLTPETGNLQNNESPFTRHSSTSIFSSALCMTRRGFLPLKERSKINGNSTPDFSFRKSTALYVPGLSLAAFPAVESIRQKATSR